MLKTLQIFWGGFVLQREKSGQFVPSAAEIRVDQKVEAQTKDLKAAEFINDTMEFSGQGSLHRSLFRDEKREKEKSGVLL
jgi:hypothetical protein